MNSFSSSSSSSSSSSKDDEYDNVHHPNTNNNTNNPRSYKRTTSITSSLSSNNYLSDNDDNDADAAYNQDATAADASSAVAVAGDHYASSDQLYGVQGAHGTVAEQPDESHYDDRYLNRRSSSDHGKDGDDGDDGVVADSSASLDEVDADFLKRTRFNFPMTSDSNDSQGLQRQQQRQRIKLYGRQSELKRLRRLYDEACCTTNSDNDNDNNNCTPPGNILFLSGTKGCGKSALLDEFIAQPSSLERRGRAGASTNRGGGGGGRRGRGSANSNSNGGNNERDTLPLLFVRHAFQQEENNDDDNDDRPSFLRVYEELKIVAFNLWEEQLKKKELRDEQFQLLKKVKEQQKEQQTKNFENDELSISSSSDSSSSSGSSSSSSESAGYYHQPRASSSRQKTKTNEGSVVDLEHEEKQYQTISSIMTKMEESNPLDILSKSSIQDLLIFICECCKNSREKRPSLFLLILEDVHYCCNDESTKDECTNDPSTSTTASTTTATTCTESSATTMDILSHILLETIASLSNLMVIVSYNSNINDTNPNNTGNQTNSIQSLIESIETSREYANNAINNNNIHQQLQQWGSNSTIISTNNKITASNSYNGIAGITKMVLHPMTLDTVTLFVRDCLYGKKKEQQQNGGKEDETIRGNGGDDVATLAKGIYEKTFGIPLFVKQALEEVVYYDVICYEWRWMENKLKLLPDYLGRDSIGIIHTIQQRLKKELPLEVQRMMMIMSCTMSKTDDEEVKFTPLTLREIMANEGFEIELDRTLSYLQHAYREGLLFANDTMIKETTRISFAHDYVRQASLECMSKEEQMALALRVFTSRLQKWNEHRLNDNHLFDIYSTMSQYKPTNKEGREMKAMVEFFDLVDPSCTEGGGGGTRSMPVSASMTVASHSSGAHLSKSMTGGRRNRARNGIVGDVSKSQHQQNNLSKSMNQRGRAIKGRRDSGSGVGGFVSSINKMKLTASITESVKSPKDSGSAGHSLASSIASMAPKKIIKLLAESMEENAVTLDASKRAKQALEFLFFPFVTDPKSVLLRHGSITMLHNNAYAVSKADKNGLEINEDTLSDERHLMLFSHGFLVANIDMQCAVSFFLALNDQDIITEENFLNYLHSKLLLGEGGDSNELKWLLNDVGLPKAGNVIHDLIQRHGSPSQLSLDWNRFCSSWKNLFTSPPTTKSVNNKVENASLFSSIAYISCLDIYHVVDLRSSEIAKSSQAWSAFGVTLDGQEKEPLIFTCPTVERRNTWVESFGRLLILSQEKSSKPEILELREKLGWQHLIVRSSFTSLVIMDDPKALEQALRYSVMDGGASHRERWTKLNALDTYNEYAALHYAVILGHNGCIDVLLKAGASIDLVDRNGLSPMIHALGTGNDEAITILEQHGAEKNDALAYVEEKKMPHDLRSYLQSPSIRRLSIEEEVSDTEELLDEAVNNFTGILLRREGGERNLRRANLATIPLKQTPAAQPRRSSLRKNKSRSQICTKSVQWVGREHVDRAMSVSDISSTELDRLLVNAATDFWTSADNGSDADMAVDGGNHQKVNPPNNERNRDDLPDDDVDELLMEAVANIGR